jgi:hypothetical protein
MKRVLLPFVFALTAFGQAAGVHHEARSVYILPMAGGFDQFLAEQLTRDHVMQVVADPKTADAVLTDRLGEPFERKLAKIHPRDEDDDDAAETHPGFRSSTAAGTIFLVDLKSRHVLWSDFEKPGRSNSQGALNRKAARVVKNLRDTLAK